MINEREIQNLAITKLLSGKKFEFNGDFDALIWNEDEPLPITKQQFDQEVEAIKTVEFAKFGIVYPPVKTTNK